MSRIFLIEKCSNKINFYLKPHFFTRIVFGPTPSKQYDYTVAILKFTNGQCSGWIYRSSKAIEKPVFEYACLGFIAVVFC